ncbi:MAG TPA: hypothetical protein VH088_12010 [Terriglobales bacterium]|nr:hypothetical protein [Terriglobales bacterium]
MLGRNLRPSGKLPVDNPMLPRPAVNASPIAALPETVKMELANSMEDAGMTEIDRIASAVDLAIAMEDS